jgi:hypothetical protein
VKFVAGLATLSLAVILTVDGATEPDSLAQDLEKRYLSTLDEWVAKGGPVSEIQERVVGTCGKLILAAASPSERVTLSTTQRDEFDFRVDVCSKMTVHRVHKQPEFENREIIKNICGGNSLPIFKRLCKHSGIVKK